MTVCAHVMTIPVELLYNLSSVYCNVFVYKCTNSHLIQAVYTITFPCCCACTVLVPTDLKTRNGRTKAFQYTVVAPVNTDAMHQNSQAKN